MAGTVTVACRIPNGLILQVFATIDSQEPVMGGGWKTVKQAVVNGAAVKINGPAVAVGKAPPHEIRNNVGLTFGVDADFYAKWAEQNKDSDFIKGTAANNYQPMVFAYAKSVDTDARAKELLTLKSGLEPVNPHDLPAEFKRKIETAPRL